MYNWIPKVGVLSSWQYTTLIHQCVPSGVAHLSSTPGLPQTVHISYSRSKSSATPIKTSHRADNPSVPLSINSNILIIVTIMQHILYCTLKYQHLFNIQCDTPSSSLSTMVAVVASSLLFFLQLCKQLHQQHSLTFLLTYINAFSFS